MKNLTTIRELLSADLNLIKDISLTESLSISRAVYPQSQIEIQSSETISDLEVLTLKSQSLSKTPLSSHEPVSLTATQKASVRSALEILKALPAGGWEWSQSFLKAIAFVKRTPSSEDEGQITSLTLPGFPGVSLFSEQSLYHAPPSIISAQDSPEILAENILHESTHQWVNFLLLTDRLLNENYSASDSPRVTIPWRSGSTDFRNKAWPLDRCLHALCVYAVICDFREHQCAGTESVFTKSHVTEARANLKFLATSLLEHKDFLDYKGLALVSALLNQASLKERAS